MGETLSAQCVSPVSSPPSDLRWYINHHAADRRLVSNQTRTRPSPSNPPRDRTSEEMVMELRTPLKYDIISGQPDTVTRSSARERRDLYSVGLRFTVRDKLRRDYGG